MQRHLFSIAGPALAFRHVCDPDLDSDAMKLDDLDAVFLDYQLGSGTGVEMLESLRSRGADQPAIVLAGQASAYAAARFTRAGADGLLMCEELAAAPRFAAIPTIILTGRSDLATIERCRAFRVRYAQKGPNAWNALLPMICETLHVENAVHCPLRDAARVAPSPPELAGDDAPPCILVDDDDPEICRAFRVPLGACGLRVAEAHSGMEGFWSALKCQPDAIITDFTMPDGQGDYLIGHLREHSLTRETPILVLTGQTVGGLVNHATERETLGLGATRFFTKPPDFAVILGEPRKYVLIRRPVPAGV